MAVIKLFSLRVLGNKEALIAQIKLGDRKIRGSMRKIPKSVF